MLVSGGQLADEVLMNFEIAQSSWGGEREGERESVEDRKVAPHEGSLLEVL